MENAKKHETQELSAQELAEISGGSDPNGSKNPTDGTYAVPGVDNPLGDVNVHDLVDEQLNNYPRKYSYSAPYSAQSEH